ncbi:hypothetical protein TRIUR3_32499 [Triticum urartu]|uniref:Uncharacterized protein n=1 Tax=Triticum urartu TaxID=4572 RepID=M7YM05_TRIUA|nr:uncharacterized protein LOC125508468 [Triticum urartu]EMS47951.1 hypothetical protein TRIUR3_32499 [Triticum urartu]
MFRGGGRSKTVVTSSSTGNELPIDGVVRARKVERIQPHNLVSRPSVHHGDHATSPVTSGPAESLAVSVVRIGDIVIVDDKDKPDSLLSVSIAWKF